MKITKAQLKKLIKEELDAQRQGLEAAGLGGMLKKVKDLASILMLSPEEHTERDKAIWDSYEAGMEDHRAKVQAAAEQFGDDSEEAWAARREQHQFIKKYVGR